jgi:hypothetical protein
MPQISEMVKYIRGSFEIESKILEWAQQRSEEFNDFMCRLLKKEQEDQE